MKMNIGMPGRLRPLSCNIQHLRTNVDANYPPPRTNFVGSKKSNVARAAANVQHRLTLRYSTLVDELAGHRLHEPGLDLLTTHFVVSVTELIFVLVHFGTPLMYFGCVSNIMKTCVDDAGKLPSRSCHAA